MSGPVTHRHPPCLSQPLPPQHARCSGGQLDVLQRGSLLALPFSSQARGLRPKLRHNDLRRFWPPLLMPPGNGGVCTAVGSPSSSRARARVSFVAVTRLQVVDLGLSQGRRRAVHKCLFTVAETGRLAKPAPSTRGAECAGPTRQLFRGQSGFPPASDVDRAFEGGREGHELGALLVNRKGRTALHPVFAAGGTWRQTDARSSQQKWAAARWLCAVGASDVCW